MGGRPCSITNKADEQNGLFPFTVQVPAGTSAVEMKLTKEDIWYTDEIVCHYSNTYPMKHDIYVTQNKLTKFTGKKLGYAWKGDTCIYHTEDALSACQFTYK